MTSLYHPKSKAVRTIRDGDELRLRLLKRAGFKIGKMPAEKAAPPPEEDEETLPSTEGEEAELVAGKDPVLAEHAPVESAQEEENPFTKMNMKELRAIAKENDVVIPFKIRKKVDIAALLHSKLDLVEEGEDEDDDGD